MITLQNGNERGNTKVMGINIINTDYVRSKTTGKCGIFQLFEQHDNK
jgi:hypothetical protein